MISSRNSVCGGREVILPWIDKEEFVDVFEALFGDNYSRKVWALGRVKVWEDRCYPLEPAIEVSVQLIQAFLHDRDDTRPEVLDAMYSMVIVRFCNYLKQNSSFNKLTDIAKEHEIPEFIVNTRNKIAHEDIPPVENLRRACLWIKRHIKASYWSNMIMKMVEHRPYQGMRPIKYNVLIQEYCTRTKKNLLSKSSIKEIKIIQKLERDIQQILHDDGHNFMLDLVATNIFIGSQESLVMLVKPEETNFLKGKALHLPSQIEKLWAAIIILLHRWGQLHNFLENILLELKNPDPFRQHLIVSWAIHIISCVLLRVPVDSSILAGYFVEHHQGLHKEKLLRCATIYKCPHSAELLPLLADQSMNTEAVDLLRQTLGVASGDPLFFRKLYDFEPEGSHCHRGRSKSNSHTRIYSLLDAQKVRFYESVQMRGLNEEEELNKWHKAMNVEIFEWQHLPVGVVICDKSAKKREKPIEVEKMDDTPVQPIEEEIVPEMETTRAKTHIDKDTSDNKYVAPLAKVKINLNRNFLEFA